VKRHQIIFFIVIVIIILSFAIIIQLFKGCSDLANWVFKFVNDWAPALSATIAVTLIVTFLWNLRENRRERARIALYSWAKDVPMVLISSRDKKDFDDIFKRGGTLLFDADSLGKKFKKALLESIDAIGDCRAAVAEGKLDELDKKMPNTLDLLSRLSEYIIKD